MHPWRIEISSYRAAQKILVFSLPKVPLIFGIDDLSDEISDLVLEDMASCNGAIEIQFFTDDLEAVAQAVDTILCRKARNAMLFDGAACCQSWVIVGKCILPASLVLVDWHRRRRV